MIVIIWHWRTEHDAVREQYTAYPYIFYGISFVRDTHMIHLTIDDADINNEQLTITI